MRSKAFIAELLGTMILCLVGVLSIWFSDGNLLAVSTAFGFIVAALIGTFHHVSGAHLNPAVTFALALTKRLKWRDAVAYWASQFLGGGLAGILILLLMGTKAIQNDGVFASGTPILGEGVGQWQGFFAEIVGTFLLVLIIFGSAVDPRSKWNPALSIGLGLTAIILATGPIAGAGLNPARFLSPAVWTGANPLTWWPWILGPILGGGFAASIYDKLILEDPKKSV